MSRTGIIRWCLPPATLTLFVVSVPASAATSVNAVLQIVELPFFILTACACFFISWALFRGPVTLPSKLLAKVMLLLAVGFAIMGAAHFTFLYQSNFSTNLLDSTFINLGDAVLWQAALLVSWLIISIGIMLVLGCVIRQQLQLQDSALSREDLAVEVDSNTDPLTNIWNRRFLFRDGEALVDQLRRERASVCLLSIDLDHFKSINDMHGRATGDMTLKHFCEVVKANIRTNDRFARNGGEEFVLLMPRVSQEEAYRIANRILISVERQSISVEGKPIHLTVSMGMVYRKKVDMTIEALLIAADKALDEAKKSGRNRLNTVNITADLENVVEFHNAD